MHNHPFGTSFFGRKGEIKMRYNKIRKMDIADGPGVRVSIFEQGCAFNCKNCFK